MVKIIFRHIIEVGFGTAELTGMVSLEKILLIVI